MTHIIREYIKALLIIMTVYGIMVDVGFIICMQFDFDFFGIDTENNFDSLPWIFRAFTVISMFIGLMVGGSYAFVAAFVIPIIVALWIYELFEN